MLEVARKDIDIWLVDDRQIEDATLLAQYAQLLSAGEVSRHQRFIYSQDKHQFLVARALVRTVLSHYQGAADPAALQFVSNQDGKPVLLTEKPLQFNLTHTKGLIALVVTMHDPVGIDLEKLSRTAQIEKLAKRYFASAEAEALLMLPEDLRAARFYDLWTLKEAYLKACGTGLRTPLREFNFSFYQDHIQVGFSPALQDDPSVWKFWQLTIDASYRLSVAVNDASGNDYQIRVKKGIPLVQFTDVVPTIERTSLT